MYELTLMCFIAKISGCYEFSSVLCRVNLFGENSIDVNRQFSVRWQASTGIGRSVLAGESNDERGSGKLPDYRSVILSCIFMSRVGKPKPIINPIPFSRYGFIGDRCPGPAVREDSVVKLLGLKKGGLAGK